jgi:hypothetical protein
MIKRWVAYLLMVALVMQACILSSVVPTKIAPQPGETLPPESTLVATKSIPTGLAPSATAATLVAMNTDTPGAPAPTFTQPPATSTQRIVTPAPQVPTPIPMKYRLQPGTPVGIAGFVHTDLGCGWMGIGGQVFALDSTPVERLVVELGGTMNGQPVSQLSLTGSATQWGPGGFEFTLANHPIESNGTLWLRVLELNGVPVSDRIFFTTYNDCSRNTILINLNEVLIQAHYNNYFPIVGR